MCIAILQTQQGELDHGSETPVHELTPHKLAVHKPHGGERQRKVTKEQLARQSSETVRPFPSCVRLTASASDHTFLGQRRVEAWLSPAVSQLPSDVAPAAGEVPQALLREFARQAVPTFQPPRGSAHLLEFRRGDLGEFFLVTRRSWSKANPQWVFPDHLPTSRSTPM